MNSAQKSNPMVASFAARSVRLCASVAIGLLCASTAVNAANLNVTQTRPAMPQSAQSLPQPASQNGVNRAMPAKAATKQTAPIPWGAGGGLEPSATGGSYAMLTQLKEENILLDQQLKIAQKTKQLQALEKQSSSDSGSGSSSGPSFSDLAALGGEPRVLLVEGRPGHVHATISLPSGGTISAKVGEDVPQVGRIISISADTVLVRTGKHKLASIPFWSSFGNTASSGASAGYNVMPPPIPAQAGEPSTEQGPAASQSAPYPNRP